MLRCMLQTRVLIYDKFKLPAIYVAVCEAVLRAVWEGGDEALTKVAKFPATSTDQGARSFRYGRNVSSAARRRG
jgi:hypothetical protein